jgi:hypothetical protein
MDLEWNVGELGSSPRAEEWQEVSTMEGSLERVWWRIAGSVAESSSRSFSSSFLRSMI